jgi:RNA polymerase sigma-70 factor, ECF subfamily
MEARANQRVRRILACCDPALDWNEQVALALHAGCGLSIEEVARAFVVPTLTMARRLTEAKARTVPWYRAVDPAAVEGDQLAAVMAALYLLFNDGFSRRVRAERCSDAIALARRA